VARTGFVCAALLVLGLWLPWATLSIGLFGGEPHPVAQVSGEEIGSGLLGVPVGWIAAGGGVLSAFAITGRQRRLALIAAAVTALAIGYTLAAIPGEETATANGQNVVNLVNGQISYAWGLFVVAAAAALLLVAAVRVARAPTDSSDSSWSTA
jgi:hypothetical protein